MSHPLALVVEDHADTAFVFDQALREAGFDTELFQDGDMAFDRLCAAGVDLVVLDLSLPHMSGVDIVHRMRADPHLAKTPIIVATAYPALAEAVQGEANVVLIKPIGFDQLRILAEKLRSSLNEEEA